MTLKDLEATLRANGVGGEDLDEMVHDAFSLDASNVNNAGMSKQLKFLVEDAGMSPDHILETFGASAPASQSSSFRQIFSVHAASDETNVRVVQTTLSRTGNTRCKIWIPALDTKGG